MNNLKEGRLLHDFILAGLKRSVNCAFVGLSSVRLTWHAIIQPFVRECAFGPWFRNPPITEQQVTDAALISKYDFKTGNTILADGLRTIDETCAREKKKCFPCFLPNNFLTRTLSNSYLTLLPFFSFQCWNWLIILTLKGVYLTLQPSTRTLIIRGHPWRCFVRE